MMRPPRTAHLAAALISAVAVMVLTLCTTLFLLGTGRPHPERGDPAQSFV